MILRNNTIPHLKQYSSEKSIAVYVHWPFCLSKCPYCDFNSHTFESLDYELWRRSYIAEIEYFAELLRGKYIKSIFFGGGTPSLMPPSLVACIIEKIGSLGLIDSATEITLEANPTSVESGKFSDFKTAGINRVSLGIQSFNEEDLKFLGRKHNADEAIAAIQTAAKHFDNYSFDLIYARPSQELSSWQAELEFAISLASKHISLYQLTIEKGTKFYSMYHKGQFILPDQDQALELYSLTNDILAQNGYRRYEISNYAVPGFESRHNLNYWHYGDYLGVGPGAHSRISFNDNGQYKMKALETVYSPQGWLEAVANTGRGTRKDQVLSDDDVVKEILMMGLRLSSGFDESVLIKFAGKKFTELVSVQLLNGLVEAGLIDNLEGKVRLSENGLVVHSQIICKLFDNLSLLSN